MKECCEYPKLFHSTNTDKKKEIRKKLFLTLNSGITKF